MMVLRPCYFPDKGCDENKGEECYAGFFPLRMMCQMEHEQYWTSGLTNKEDT